MKQIKNKTKKRIINIVSITLIIVSIFIVLINSLTINTCSNLKIELAETNPDKYMIELLLNEIYKSQLNFDHSFFSSLKMKGLKIKMINGFEANYMKYFTTLYKKLNSNCSCKILTSEEYKTISKPNNEQKLQSDNTIANTYMIYFKNNDVIEIFIKDSTLGILKVKQGNSIVGWI